MIGGTVTRCIFASVPLRVSIVDLSGEANIAYTPLAAMYLKAAILDLPDLSDRVSVRLHHFLQSHTAADMLEEIVAFKPNVVGFCCQGWNFRQFCSLFLPLKQFLPNCFIVIGGNHVTHRGERLLRIHPEVDALVNGEGEFTFRELILALMEKTPIDGVAGLSFVRDREVITTNQRPLTRQMSLIPSAYSLPDLDLRQFDVALIETNRGCPYMCGFCYWGGRIGQKLAKGDLDRVQIELETVGRSGIETIFLCDANFGILEQDVEIARIVVDVFHRYGCPREFNVNWAKNHADRVEQVISILRNGGIRTTINVPLQTLSEKALDLSGRGEIGRRAMIDLAQRMVREGTELYCELIFGLPGETLSDFKKNYDCLFLEYPILRIHPLWILPNTAYEQEREKHGIRTISPDPSSDYEAVLMHNDINCEEMREGLSMLLAHSILNLLGTARDPLRLLALHSKRSVSKILCDFEPFLASCQDGLGSELHSLFLRIRRAAYFERSLRDQKRRLLYRNQADTLRLVLHFLDQLDMPKEIYEICIELARYNCILLPRSDLANDGFAESEHVFNFDPRTLSMMLACGDTTWDTWLHSVARPTKLVVRHKSGLAKLNGSNCDLTGSWNGRVVSSMDAVLESAVL